MNFKEVIKEIKKLSPKEQACFVYRLTNNVDLSICESIHKYASNRIERNDNIRDRHRGNH